LRRLLRAHNEHASDATFAGAKAAEIKRFRQRRAFYSDEATMEMITRYAAIDWVCIRIISFPDARTRPVRDV
jgi:hypothetical protein